MAILESVIEKYLCKEVKKIGGKAYKMDARTYAGIPDRIVLYRGQSYFVELKAPGKLPRPLQLAVHRELRNYGYDTLIIDSKEGVDKFIQEIQPNERN